MRIKHSIVLDEAHFQDDDLEGFEKLIPSRSPSPVRRNLAGADDGHLELNSEEAVYVEDDVDLDEQAANMTKKQMK